MNYGIKKTGFFQQKRAVTAQKRTMKASSARPSGTGNSAFVPLAIRPLISGFQHFAEDLRNSARRLNGFGNLVTGPLIVMMSPLGAAPAVDFRALCALAGPPLLRAKTGLLFLPIPILPLLAFTV